MLWLEYSNQKRSSSKSNLRLFNVSFISFFIVLKEEMSRSQYSLLFLFLWLNHPMNFSMWLSMSDSSGIKTMRSWGFFKVVLFSTTSSPLNLKEAGISFSLKSLPLLLMCPNHLVHTDLVSCLKYIFIDGMPKGTDIEIWVLSFPLTNSERNWTGGKVQPRHKFTKERMNRLDFTTCFALPYILLTIFYGKSFLVTEPISCFSYHHSQMIHDIFKIISFWQKRCSASAILHTFYQGNAFLSKIAKILDYTESFCFINHFCNKSTSKSHLNSIEFMWKSQINCAIYLVNCLKIFIEFQ